jgi:hypothetical protein
MCFVRGVSPSKAIFAYLQEIKRSKKVKGKIHPITCNEETGQRQTYSSTLSLTSALDGGGFKITG